MNSPERSVHSDGKTLVALADRLRAREAALLTLPILQPAEPFLDLAGEGLRRRMLLATDAVGHALCLRPEFTIPVALHHIGHGSGARRYGCAGTVFRQSATGAAEILQAGIEAIGDEDRPIADARAIADAVALLGEEGARTEIRLGDQAMFEALTRALGLPAAWFRRLVRLFGDAGALRDALRALESGGSDTEAPETRLGADHRWPDDVARALGARDPKELEVAIASHVEAARMELGRRDASEIAARMLEREEIEGTRLGGEAAAALRAFLSLDVALPDVREAIAALGVADARLEATVAQNERRIASLAAMGLEAAAIRFRGALGRPLDYYTGLVFELGLDGRSVGGGGRYDELLTLLGSPAPAPAVGFAIDMTALLDMRGHAP